MEENIKNNRSGIGTVGSIVRTLVEIKQKEEVGSIGQSVG